jgi:carboxymethylenebutenolidase
MPVAATVSFYGGGIRRARWPGIAPAIDLAATVSAPWIGFYGDKDTGIPVEEVERLRTALELAAAPTEIIRYPHAAHAFALDAAEHRYAPVEAQDAWRRTWAFLAAHLHS